MSQTTFIPLKAVDELAKGSSINSETPLVPPPIQDIQEQANVSPEASQPSLKGYPRLQNQPPIMFPGRNPTPEQSIEATKKLENINIFDAAFRGNILPTMVRSMGREFEFPPDPTFDNKAWFTQNATRVPSGMWPGLMEAESAEEGEAIILQMTKDSEDRQALHRAGMGGVAAELVVGLFDIDSVVIAAGAIGKMGKALTVGSKLGQAEAAAILKQPAKTVAAQQASLLQNPIIQGAAQGATVGGGFGAGQYVFDPNAEPSAIAGGLLFGLGLGAGLGTAIHLPEVSALRKRATTIAREMPENFATSFTDSRYGIDRNAWNTDPPYTRTGNIIEGDVFSHSKAEDMITSAREAVKRIPSNIKASPIATGFQKIIDKTFIQSDASRLFESGSDVLKHLAYETLEHPSGMFRNNRSSAMLKNVYEESILSPFMEQYDTLYNSWAKSRGVNIMDRFSQANRDIFHRELYLEQYYKSVNGGKSSPNSSSQAIDAGIQLDKGGEAAHSIMRGRAGEIALDGADGFESYKGYFPLQWSGLNVLSTINKFGETKVLDLMKKAYRSALSETDEDTIDKLAKAVIRRARAKGKDMDTAMFNYNQKDSRAYMKQILDDHGIGEDIQEGVLASLLPKTEERARAGFTKRRTPIALDASDGELSVLDLVDTNIPYVWSRYGRQVSGRSALARKGITNKTKLDDIINIGSEEAQIKGSTLTSDYIQGIFEEFHGGPTHGGLSNAMRRIRQGSNLALLSQLGIPQMAEYGVIVSSVGFDRFLHYSPIAAGILKEGKAGQKNIAEQLQYFAGTSWNEHRLFRADLALDYAKHTVDQNSQFLRNLDLLLAKGQRAQGYISGYYAIRPLQMKTAIMGVSDKFFNHLRAGNWKELSRWEDMGFTHKTMNEFKEKYIDTGIVKWGENGKYVDDLGMDNWSGVDIENYRLALNRFTSQVVQKAQIGETSGWFHKNEWSLLTHLNQFPLLAIQKQLSRNIRIADPAALTTFLYGMTSASMAYAIKQIVNGKTDRLDAEHIVRGGLALSNMTGFLPMMFDPLLYAIGGENFQLSPYGGTGGRAATLPAMQVAQDLMNIPRPLFKMDFKPADAKAFHSIPIIGRMYGVSAFIDAMAADDAIKAKPVGW